MKLFVLPPAFGLPSIDAECNAAIALLQLRVSGRYELVPTHDLSKPLPYLIDGPSRLYGFNNIVRHFADKRIHSEDANLDDQRRADSLAITSFIEAQAQTLLDISLYVSFENYRHITRPAFTKVLPWYANYIIPPQRRAAARARTEHLGISSLDVDNVHEDMSNRPPGFEAVGKEQPFEADAQKRASLLLPQKDNLRSLLQRPEHSAVFKLHAVAEAFFEPVRELLGSGDFLMHTDEPHAVDCLLYGYLSLMLYPKAPQDWLASTLRRRYPSLVRYTQRLHEKLALTTNVDDVVALKNCATRETLVQQRQPSNLSLPWSVPTISTASTIVASIGNGILDQLPLLGTSSKLHLQHAPQPSWLERHFPALLVSVIASCAGIGYLALNTGWLVWPHGEQVQIFGRRRFADYGHLGAALAGLDLRGLGE